MTFLRKQPVDRNIHERGCLRAGEDWLEAHLISVAACCVGLLVLQVLTEYLLRPSNLYLFYLSISHIIYDI